MIKTVYSKVEIVIELSTKRSFADFLAYTLAKLIPTNSASDNSF